MNEQMSGDKPKDRYWWLAGIVAILVVILYWGFQTAIQMEEGPGDDTAATG